MLPCTEMIIHRKILRSQESTSEKAAGGTEEWGEWCTGAGNVCQALLCNCLPESSGFSLNICSIRARVGNLNINSSTSAPSKQVSKSSQGSSHLCSFSFPLPDTSTVCRCASHFKGEGEAHLENCCIGKIRQSITPLQDGVENIWCPGSVCCFF